MLLPVVEITIGLLLISIGLSYEGKKWMLAMGLIAIAGWVIAGIGVYGVINWLSWP